MRILAILLVAVNVCCAQSEQGKVEAVLKQLEHAEQTGNFNTFVELWTREKSRDIEKMRPYAAARPEVRYRVTKTYVRGDEAVVLAQRSADSFAVMTLRKESGQWKIQDQLWKDIAPDANSVYAVAPPEPGAFARAGSHWDQVTPGMDASQAARLGWQMKAIFDESYLYIRIESSTELPAAGGTITTPPGGWPVLKIDTSDAGEFVLYDAVNAGDQATFDEHGKANSHRRFADYTIRFERRDHEIFSASAYSPASPLLQVGGKNYEIRIPLETMGITDSSATKMTIGDAQWPKSAVISFAVPRYSR